MYKISVPVMMHERFCKEACLAELNRVGAKRVFLALDILCFNKAERQKIYPMLDECIKYFKVNGLEVGIWFWTFWRSDRENADPTMLNFRGLDGSIEANFFCPTSSAFTEHACECIRELTALNPDILMFDDDFRFGYHSTGIGCCCDNHLQMMSEKLGEKVVLEGLDEKAFLGGANKYRDAWLDSMGESLISFAKAVRKAVDSVNKSIRFALSSCMSLWDADGVDAITITKILAGETKPLLRYSGAPYWAVDRIFKCRLQHVVEIARMEASWCPSDIETMAEGDVFPRPRHRVPACFLESFDTAVRASGAACGCLKYMLDYTSSTGYETGYCDRHAANADLYAEIDRIFSGKTDVGVRIYDYMKKIRNADFDEKEYVGSRYIQHLFFPPAAKLLTDNSIPTTYTESSKVGVVFGENAKYLSDSEKNGNLILDIKAAEILMKSGIDVGITKLNEALSHSITDMITPDITYYPKQNEYVSNAYGDNALYNIEIKDTAKVTAIAKIGGREYIDSFYYENANKQKFLVFAFDAYRINFDCFRTYCMQALLWETIEEMDGQLPAKCLKNPDLYMLCKRSDDGVAIGLWNFFQDEITKPVITLNGSYTAAVFINCSGSLTGNTIELSPIKAYGCAMILLK